MRLFSAVLPPPAAADQLAAAVEALHTLPGAGGLRWTAREGWHFTLGFYGEVDETEVPDLQSGLARAAALASPFALALRGGGTFGDRALWVGATGDLDALHRLAVDARSAHPGGAEEHRPYRPHLTLARSRTGVPAPFGPFLALLDTFRGSSWEAAELVLMRCSPREDSVPGVPRYEKAASWRLGGAR